MIQAISGLPVTVKLTDYINNTGWTMANGSASHASCSGGDLRLKNILTETLPYEVTYNVKTLVGGSLLLKMGNKVIRAITQIGFYTDSFTATSDKLIFSAAVGVTAEVNSFTYKQKPVDNSTIGNPTIAFSEKVDKWTSFYTYAPDYGFSLKGNLFTLKEGLLYKHDVNAPRNTFYGVEYDSTVKFPMNQALNLVKNFQNIEIQSNTLLVTTTDGVQTSLGQVSDLIAEDFRQFSYNSGTVSVDVYDLEGVYQAKFLRDKRTDILEGDRLKGSFMTIELTTTTSQNFKLYRVYVNAEPSTSGI